MGVKVVTEIDKGLKRAAAANKRARNKALNQGAAHVAHTLEGNTPVGNHSIHLADSVVVSGVKATGEIQVGYNKDVAYRAHFVEMGTIKQKPQGFIQRTVNQTEREFMTIVENILRKELGL